MTRLPDRQTGGQDCAPSLLLLLSLASSLSPFGMIVVVPTLAAVAAQYAIAEGQAQFLIAAYVFGLGAGQPVIGALADRYGRRPVMVAGFGLFTVASVACALVPDFGWLVLARFAQALGVSVGTVGSRAIIRDTHDAIGATQALAWVGAAMGIAPVIGPVIGGLLGAAAGPQAVFVVSAMLGGALMAALALRLPETRSAGPPSPDVVGWPASYRVLLGSRVFMGYTLMYAFMQGGFFAFLAVAALVFDEHLGLGQQQFGAIWGGMALVYVATTVGSVRITSRLGPARVLLAGSLLAALAGWALVLSTLGGVSLAGLLLPLAAMMASAGVQTPLVLAGTVNCRPDVAATAAGLSSSLALVASGTFSIVAGLAYSGSFTPIALLIAATGTLTVVAYRMTRPRNGTRPAAPSDGSAARLPDADEGR